MMQETLILTLNVAQVDQLMSYCPGYRVHAWREFAPTAERNQTLRAIQAVQGRLTVWRAERRTETLRFAVSEEERQSLRQMVGVLMQVSSVIRNQLFLCDDSCGTGATQPGKGIRKEACGMASGEEARPRGNINLVYNS